jgi:hypothetical protein
MNRALKRKRKHNVKACRRLSQPLTTKEMAIREAIMERLQEFFKRMEQEMLTVMFRAAEEARHRTLRLTLQTNVNARRN